MVHALHQDSGSVFDDRFQFGKFGFEQAVSHFFERILLASYQVFFGIREVVLRYHHGRIGQHIHLDALWPSAEEPDVELQDFRSDLCFDFALGSHGNILSWCAHPEEVFS